MLKKFLKRSLAASAVFFMFCFGTNNIHQVFANEFYTYEEASYGELLGRYVTEFDSQKSARGKNIMIASKRIDGIVVNPGEEFSFNEAVGPTNKKNGFKEARIFVKGKESKGFGGGVCQVSSTLYNAVDAVGLEVTERHEHSKDVQYVPDGRDASTSYGGVDFKFVNNKDFPIIISSYVVDNKVIVDILR